jgi:hypothetical protein
VKQIMANGNTYSLEQQSSICLYLALKQRRRGVEFDPDTALSSQELFIDPSGVKWIVDGWGNPLIFNRWPAPVNPAAPLNPPVPQPPAATLGLYQGYGFLLLNPLGTAQNFDPARPGDPQDPEGLLTSQTSAAWLMGLTTPAQQQALASAFSNFVAYPLAQSGQQFTTTPVIMSLGANGKYDGLYNPYNPNPRIPSGTPGNGNPSGTGGDDIINFQIQ